MQTKTFIAIRDRAGLQKFLESASGSLYFDPTADDRGVATLLVRHFDRDLPASLIPAFVELAKAAQEWLGRHPAVSRCVVVEQPVDVGEDYVARHHHVYFTSLRSYDEPDEDEPVEPPDELGPMRAAFRAAAGQSRDERDRLVEAVLARSLLGPSGKTYLGNDDRFVVAELSPTRAELERFAQIHAMGT
jgi:hypothetical protein